MDVCGLQQVDCTRLEIVILHGKSDLPASLLDYLMRHDNGNRMMRLVSTLTPIRQYPLDSACTSFEHAVKKLVSQLASMLFHLCPGHAACFLTLVCTYLGHCADFRMAVSRLFSTWSLWDHFCEFCPTERATLRFVPTKQEGTKSQISWCRSSSVLIGRIRQSQEKITPLAENLPHHGTTIPVGAPRMARGECATPD